MITVLSSTYCTSILLYYTCVLFIAVSAFHRSSYQGRLLSPLFWCLVSIAPPNPSILYPFVCVGVDVPIFAQL